jgi:hypothetical protein
MRQPRGLVDCHVERLVEVAAKPARGDAWAPAPILARDQQCQLERLGEAKPADLLRGRLDDEQVSVLECLPAKSTPPPWVARTSRWGLSEAKRT